MIVPQTSLIGFGLVVFPLLQLPMLGTVMCICCQAGGTWMIFGAVWLFMIAQISPFIPGMNALGPHKVSTSFKLMFKDWRLPIFKGVCFAGALALMVLTAIDADVSVSINIDDLLGAFSQKVLLGLKVILNFVKAKTFTVVMSADLFLNLLIQLEMYEVLCKSTTKRVNDRMLAGLLLERTPAEAKDLLDEFDANRDGVFDGDEIEAMMKKVNKRTIDNLQFFENKANDMLQKKKEKREAAARGQDNDAPVMAGALATALELDVA